MSHFWCSTVVSSWTPNVCPLNFPLASITQQRGIYIHMFADDRQLCATTGISRAESFAKFNNNNNNNVYLIKCPY